jgi:HAD superfamily hydrolase (TIGR01509 family)
MIKGFFFDLDGTLVDTHMANFEAYRRAIQDVAATEIAFDAFKKSIGQVAKTFLPQLVPGLQEIDYERIAALKADYYRDQMHMTQLNEGLVAFMELVKDAHLVLVTTAKRRNAEAVLRHHNLERFFSVIITSEDVEHAKPNPEAYQLALRKTGLTAAEAVAFEDSEVGHVAAESAGLSVVMINTFTL